MQEGMSYLAGAELPCVIADIMRGGPGLGNIAPEQGDYNQIVKGGGHGYYRTLVLAPASVQEMADFTTLAFDLADRYRNPVVVLADGNIGQMMEPVCFADPVAVPAPPDWAVLGTAATRPNLISSIFLEPEELERHVLKLEAKYRAAECEVRSESYRTEDAEIVLIGYGIMGRILKAVVDQGRRHGTASACCARSRSIPSPPSESASLPLRSRGSWSPNSAPASWSTTFAWRSKAAGRWSSSAARAAWCLPRKRCWNRWSTSSHCRGYWSMASLTVTQRQAVGFLRPLRTQRRVAAPDALLPRMRPRHRSQTAGPGASTISGCRTAPY